MQREHISIKQLEKTYQQLPLLNNRLKTHSQTVNGIIFGDNENQIFKFN